MKSLYENTIIGGIEVRNRFMRSGTHEGLSADGSITEDVIDFYKKLADQDVGLIVSSGLEVTEEKVFHNSFRINSDVCIEPLKNLTDAVHASGAKIMSQLFHGGSFIFIQPDYEPLGPSAIQDRFTKVTPKEMTVQDIMRIVGRFADAAYRSKEAGFDGVQIQASASFLVNKFLSPYYNQRTDEYGGSIENRSRIAVQIRQTIAEKCGKDYPVFIKLTIDDLMKDDVKGLEFTEGKKFAMHLATSGYNAIEVIGGLMGEIPLSSQYNNGKPFFMEEIIELSSEINIPLIANGGVRTEKDANLLIENEMVEAVSFSRPFIADPDLVRRFKNGKNTKCITCFQCNGPNGIRCIKN